MFVRCRSSRSRGGAATPPWGSRPAATPPPPGAAPPRSRAAMAEAGPFSAYREAGDAGPEIRCTLRIPGSCLSLLRVADHLPMLAGVLSIAADGILESRCSTTTSQVQELQGLINGPFSGNSGPCFQDQ